MTALKTGNTKRNIEITPLKFLLKVISMTTTELKEERKCLILINKNQLLLLIDL